MATTDTVLLVEDDRALRDMMAFWLRAEVYRVLKACDGREALSALRLETPCAMVVDLDMPVMDGAELRRRQLGSAAIADIPLILVSASGDSERIGHELHVDGVIPKPLDAARLLAALATHCRCHYLDGGSSDAISPAGTVTPC